MEIREEGKWETELKQRHRKTTAGGRQALAVERPQVGTDPEKTPQSQWGRKGQREEAVWKLRQPQTNNKLDYRKICWKDACWTRQQLEPETSQKARSQRGEGKRSP